MLESESLLVLKLTALRIILLAKGTPLLVDGFISSEVLEFEVCNE